MSTLNSRAVLAAACGLFACGAPVDVARLAPESVRLADSVVVAGPPGYCVAPETLRQSAAAAFVVLGSCAALTNGAKNEAPAQAGLLTVLVSPPGEGEALSDATDAQLREFFSSDAGKVALSSNGDVAAVEVIEAQAEEGQVFVRARDLSGKRPRGMDQEYWRALLDVNGHLVTATLIGFESDPVEPAQGLRTLSQLTNRLLRDNPSSLDE